MEFIEYVYKLNWEPLWVFLSAVGTIGAVVVALFGEPLKRRLFPPSLQLSLRDPRGETVTVRQTRGGAAVLAPIITRQARYYHLIVSNSKRWPTVQDVRVLLLEVQELGQDGQFTTIWTGATPMRWRHQEFEPPAKPVGPSADVDLCSIIKDQSVSLLTLFSPTNLPGIITAGARKRFKFQAQGIEVDSSPLLIEIAWNGQWSDNPDEMANGLVVKEIFPDARGAA